MGIGKVQGLKFCDYGFPTGGLYRYRLRFEPSRTKSMSQWLIKGYITSEQAQGSSSSMHDTEVHQTHEYCFLLVLSEG